MKEGIKMKQVKYLYIKFICKWYLTTFDESSFDLYEDSAYEKH